MTAQWLYGKGLSFPPRVGQNGSLVWSMGELNVRECLCIILRTSVGERVGRPAFGCGINRMLGEPNSVATLRLIQDEVTQAVSRWEPRVVADQVTAKVNEQDQRDVDVMIRYTLIATGTQERLSLTVGADR